MGDNHRHSPYAAMHNIYTCFGLSGFHGENKKDPVGVFYFHHNFDGEDLPVLMVKIKFTPDLA